MHPTWPTRLFYALGALLWAPSVVGILLLEKQGSRFAYAVAAALVVATGAALISALIRRR